MLKQYKVRAGYSIYHENLEHSEGAIVSLRDDQAQLHGNAVELLEEAITAALQKRTEK